MFRKLLALVVLLVPSSLLWGCGAMIQVKNGSEYDITLDVNGRTQEFEFPDGRRSFVLRTSESGVMKIPTMNLGGYVGVNGSGYGHQPTEVVMVASAWQSAGGKREFVSTATNKFWLYSDRERHIWIITNEDFQERYGWTHSGGGVLGGIFR